jgi:hypothetical protein
VAIALEYVNDDRVYVAQQLFVHADAWAAAKRNHYIAAVTWVLVLLAASYAAVKAELVFLLFGFVLVLIAHVAHTFPYSRVQRRAIGSAIKALAPKHVRLVADERGLHETADGIDSFAPWTSVRSFALFEDVLFIELSARLWALVPRYGLQKSSASIEQLVELLRAKGIVERGRTSVA